MGNFKNFFSCDSISQQSKQVKNMDAMSEDEELMFDSSGIEKLVNTTVENVIGDSIFSDKDSKTHINKIVESLLTQLQTLNKPFKYIITVLIEQRSGAALYSSSDCRWAANDGHCAVNWNNESTHALVTVFGLNIQ